MCSVACEQALELGVWVFVEGRGWGEGKEWELAAMSHEFECLRWKSLRKMLIGRDLIWSFKTITTRGSIIREACENVSKYLVSLMELRPEQLQAAKTFCYHGFDLSVVCPLQSIIDEQIAEIWEALRLRLPKCQMESWDRPNFSFYFAQPKKRSVCEFLSCWFWCKDFNYF